MLIPDTSVGLSVDCNQIRPISKDCFVALVVINEDDINFVSRLVVCELDVATLRVDYEILFEVEEWVTSFLRVDANKYVLGTSIGEIVCLTADNITSDQVCDRAITALHISEESEIIGVSAAGKCLAQRAGSWLTVADFGIENSLFGIATGGCEVVVCGQNGFVAKSVSGSWELLERITNSQLNCVSRVSNGFVVAGNRGVCYHMRGEEFVSIDGIEGNIHDLTYFKDRLYLAAGESSVVSLDFRSVELASVFDGIKPFGVAANDEILVAYSGLDFAIYDGEKWTL
ncbi:MAG: hypothetical protein AAFQ09_09720 [Pseudomonadota bacterium]